MPVETPPAPQSDVEMSIWDHLEELRSALIRAVIGIVVGMIFCAIFTDWILNDVILAPALKVKPPFRFFNPEIYGQLELYMQVIIWGGVILSFPFTLIQIWKFVEPGLRGSGSVRFEEATATPQSRPSTTIGAPTDERTPRSRNAAAIGPEAAS